MDKQLARDIFTINRVKFAALYEVVKTNHQNAIDSGKVLVGGHGWDHDLRVAQTGALIADDDRIGEMAWVAGLMHSTDRHFGERTNEVLLHYFSLLPQGEFNPLEMSQMLDAVLNHSGKNSPSDEDNPVLVTLKDADRLANLGAINFIRGGQHRPNIPAVIPEYLGRRDPRSTFRDIKSCYDALWFNLEWEDMIRLPKAKVMAKKHFDRIREWQRWAVDEMEEVGLYPWPG